MPPADLTPEALVEAVAEARHTARERRIGVNWPSRAWPNLARSAREVACEDMRAAIAAGLRHAGMTAEGLRDAQACMEIIAHDTSLVAERGYREQAAQLLRALAEAAEGEEARHDR